MNNQIEVLSNKEKARERINVFHDSSLNWINLIKELVGNSIDIFNDDETVHHNINIELITNKKICYQDDATGIPVEDIASNGQQNYIAIFETDFAGSRYGNKGKTVGQNGLFLWTLAMSSEDLEVEIGRPNGNVYRLRYHKGDRIGGLEIIGHTDKTYSKLTFSPDEDIWTSPNFTFEEVSQICEGQSSMSNVSIYLKDSLGNENTYEYGNIKDYFDDKTKNKSFVSDSISFNSTINQLVKVKKEKYDMDIELVMRFSNDDNDDFKKDFLNTADLIKFGTIKEGIITGLKMVVNKYLKDNKLYKDKEKQITNEDVDLGLNYVVSVKSNFAEYVSQSKQSTDNECYKEALQTFIKGQMESFIAENGEVMNIIAQQILVNKRSREKANASRASVKKQLMELNQKGILSKKIEGLKDCDMKHSTVDERWLILTEGLSPASTITQAYDNRTMGSLGMRGRFISSLKCSVADVLNNEPAKKIIDALGCGIEIPYEERKEFKDIKTFDIDNLRYGNVLITVDADSWGEGIKLSLLAFFYKFFPTLLKQGRIHYAISPRYTIELKKGFTYAYNDEEKENIIKEQGNNIRHIGIVKGIGEISAQKFWTYVLSPEARKKTFVKVKYEGTEEEIKRAYDMFIGEDIDGRKEFIRNNIVDVEAVKY